MMWTKGELIQAGVGAFIVGALGFLAVWSQIEDLRVMITAGLVPAFTHMGIALGVQGVAHRRNGQE